MGVQKVGFKKIKKLLVFIKEVNQEVKQVPKLEPIIIPRVFEKSIKLELTKLRVKIVTIPEL